jgi:hypothetical protein
MGTLFDIPGSVQAKKIKAPPKQKPAEINLSGNPDAVTGVGASATRVGMDTVSNEILAAELALSTIGNFEPLDIKLDHWKIEEVINEKYCNDWVDYLPRTDRPNNRKSLSLTTIPGWNHQSPPSLPEATKKLGRPVREAEFCVPTDLYNDCDMTSDPSKKSLKAFLDEWQPLGRSFIVNSGTGGYFVPHRDHPGMPRPCFRLVAFLKNVGPLEYDWWMDDRKANIELGRVYYVNTRMTHRTISWVNDSWHLILNVPMTPENVDKVLKNLQHRH